MLASIQLNMCHLQAFRKIAATEKVERVHRAVLKGWRGLSLSRAERALSSKSSEAFANTLRAAHISCEIDVQERPAFQENQTKPVGAERQQSAIRRRHVAAGP